MATTGAAVVTVTGTLTALPLGSLTISETIQLTAALGVVVQALGSGPAAAVAIPVPTGATLALIVPTNLAANSGLFLLGALADTNGIAIDPNNPTLLALGTNATLFLQPGAGLTVTAEVVFL